MKILLVHQNFPGQYRHLAAALRHYPGAQVVALGDAKNLESRPEIPGLKRLPYRPAREPTPRVHPYLKHVEAAVLRGQAVARAAQEMRHRGFVPDLICAHAAWGEALYLRDIFPDAVILGYFEFYYHGTGADVGFDPEFPATLDDRLRIRTWNMIHDTSVHAVDWGHTPTQWQASMFPQAFRQRLSVVHEGIDTSALRPDPEACFELTDGRKLTRQTPVVTYVSRALEPYRGFHRFMRALPELQRRHPAVQVVVVGRDTPSYGRKPDGAANWREKMLAELEGQLDLTRIHFTGTLPYTSYCRLLQVSAAHVYLTYPFVLSWSLLEAMALGAPIVASGTPPVREAIEHERTGLLFDFFDQDAMLDGIDRLLADQALARSLGEAARAHVVQHYDLRRVCLPELLRLADRLLAARNHAAAAPKPAPAQNMRVNPRSG